MDIYYKSIKMENKFLTKKTKIIIREEKEPVGLKTALSARKESGEFNSSSLTDFNKKMSSYYNFDDEDFTPKKVNRTDYEEQYETEALGAGKMSGLRYDNEDTEVFKSFEERIDDLNDTSEYDDIFGTHDGFGEGKKSDNTYKKLKDSGEKYIKHKYEEPDEYHYTPKVRITDKPIKEGKMKRLNFKNEFKSELEVKKLIPEHYKYDGHVFLMTDGNETYKVRWDESLNEGTVLSYNNKSMINEDLNKMKKLFNYKYSDSMGKSNNYGEETKTFNKLFESSKGKTLL
jgi:hypothetical protein